MAKRMRRNGFIGSPWGVIAHLLPSASWSFLQFGRCLPDTPHRPQGLGRSIVIASLSSGVTGSLVKIILLSYHPYYCTARTYLRGFRMWWVPVPVTTAKAGRANAMRILRSSLAPISAAIWATVSPPG